MYLRTILIVLVLGTLALFTVANWQAFTTPTTLSLIVGTVEAPLGLLLFGVVVLLVALFLIYVVYLQSSVLFEPAVMRASWRANASWPSMQSARASVNSANFGNPTQRS